MIIAREIFSPNMKSRALPAPVSYTYAQYMGSNGGCKTCASLAGLFASFKLIRVLMLYPLPLVLGDCRGLIYTAYVRRIVSNTRSKTLVITRKS